MPKVKDILHFLDSIAPVKYALGFDNVGLLVGDGDRDVSKVLVALDITKEVIDEACAHGADLIVAHHPVIFEPLKSVVKGNITADHVIALVENKISAICMHTNLDAAEGGVNDILANKIGIKVTGVIEPIEEVGIGRVGKLAEDMDFDTFLTHTASALNIDGLRYCKVTDSVKKVAVGGGSCGSMLGLVKEIGCDTFVTADVKHSIWIEARELGINLIDAGHFSTENVVVEPLREKIAAEFESIEVKSSALLCEPMKHFFNKES